MATLNLNIIAAHSQTHGFGVSTVQFNYCFNWVQFNWGFTFLYHPHSNLHFSLYPLNPSHLLTYLVHGSLINPTFLGLFWFHLLHRPQIGPKKVGLLMGLSLIDIITEDAGVLEEDIGGEEEEDSYEEPPEEAKVFVGNLPYDCDSEQLGKLFRQAGVVDIAELEVG